ncbi:MAG: DUF6787 family protein [Prolixibacteraceae bacterium]
MFKRFKKKWNITSNLQLIIILVVFSITGSAALIAKKYVFELIGISPETPLLLKIPLYIIVILPSYQILLLVIGALFGQFRFFYEFQKKSLSFMKSRNKNKDEQD